MRNQRLKEAMTALGLRMIDLGPRVGVHAKTAQRWVYEGRTPRRATADRVAAYLGVPADYLWPHLNGQETPVPADLRRLYLHRRDVPRQLWLELLRGAHHHIDILAVAGLFLVEENPAFIGLLRRKGEAGVRIRIALTDPDSAALRRRADEQMLYETLIHRAEIASDIFDPLVGLPAAEYRQHAHTVYTTIVRCDDQMLVNHHLYGIPGHLAPLLHLKRANDGDLFDLFLASFERAWHISGSPVL